eukprot:scaffold351_cov371-Prasinococcus_capsulatus_cf.AAC.2
MEGHQFSQTVSLGLILTHVSREPHSLRCRCPTAVAYVRCRNLVRRNPAILVEQLPLVAELLEAHVRVDKGDGQKKYGREILPRPETLRILEHIAAVIESLLLEEISHDTWQESSSRISIGTHPKSGDALARIVASFLLFFSQRNRDPRATAELARQFAKALAAAVSRPFVAQSNSLAFAVLKELARQYTKLYALKDAIPELEGTLQKLLLSKHLVDLPDSSETNNMLRDVVEADEARNEGKRARRDDLGDTSMNHRAAFVEEKLLSLRYSAAREELDDTSDQADRRILGNLRKTVARTPSLLQGDHVPVLLSLCFCGSDEVRRSAWELLKVRIAHSFCESEAEEIGNHLVRALEHPEKGVVGSSLPHAAALFQHCVSHQKAILRCLMLLGGMAHGTLREILHASLPLRTHADAFLA